jgi:hypothetical protein
MITTPPRTPSFAEGKFQFPAKCVAGIVLIAFCAFLLSGCDKTNLKPITRLQIRLTDAPLDAEEVNVHIKEVSVNLTDDTTWITLRTNANSYNLLDYRNGKDTLIAEGQLPATKFVKNIRLILGDNNNIKMDGEEYPLDLSNSSQKEVTLFVNSKLNKNIETFTIDFDAASSVIQTSKESFQLKPVVTFRKQQ